MFMGHANGLSEHRSFAYEESKVDSNGEMEPEEILYEASFEGLANNNVKYDTIIWVSISLLLVLAWGVGILMLLYLPLRRYVLRKDVSSRKLYVTPVEIVYKVSRPSFIPFWGMTKFERRIPLSLLIDIIIEQGWLQSIYGLHTFRIHSVSLGKAAPVDQLQLQGVDSPTMLRKVIIKEALKNIQDVGKIWNLPALADDGQSTPRIGSPTPGPTSLRSPSQSWKMASSPHHLPVERQAAIPGEVLLYKLEEVNKSVKKIELLVGKPRQSQPSPAR